MRNQGDEQVQHQEQILNAQSTLIDVFDEGVCIFERLPLRPDGLRDYRFISMNKAVQAMFGIPDLSGQSIRDNFPEEVEDWFDDYDQVLKTGRLRRFEREMVPKGTLLEMFLARLEDGSGKRLLAVFKDVTERRQTAKALLKSENRLNRAQSAAKIGTWEWDVLNNLNEWSDETFFLYGLNPAETTPSYENWLASVCPEDRSAVTALISDALAKGAELDFQCRNLHNGRWLMYRGQPEFDPKGQLVRYLGIVFDITELRLAEQRIAESEQSFRGLFDNVLVGAAQLDLNGRFRLVNQRFCEMIGYTSDELVGRLGPLDLTHPDDLGVDRPRIARLLAGQHYNAEKRFVRKNGKVIWIHVTASPVRDESGQLKFMAGIIEDITERKLAEHSLWESQARLQLFIQHAPAALSMFDRDMRYLAASRRWREDYHLSDRDIIGHCHYDIFPEISEDWKKIHQRALAGEEIRSEEDRFVRGDGTVHWLRWQVLPWYSNDGMTGGILIFSEDITARKEAEEGQRRAEELARERMDDAARLQRLDTASELTTLMAHEINQPLAAVAAYAGVCQQILKSPDPDTEKIRDAIGRVSQQALRAGEIIHHIRRFVARNPSTPEPIHLNSAIRITQELIEVSARMKKIRLVLDLDPDLPKVMGVEVHIRQVLLNLLRNAVEAITSCGVTDGTITIKTRLSRNMARVTVTDNGPGIPREQAEQIFNRGSSQKQDGLGLGLSISRSLIESDRGRLWVEPRVPGGIFHFEVPLAENCFTQSA